MSLIRTTCPTCGDVTLTCRQVRLVEASAPELSSYTFRCPSCRQQVRRRAEPAVVALLLAGGVRPEPWDVPAEALEPHSGPPLGYDDVLDFALALASRDCLVAVLAPVPPR